MVKNDKIRFEGLIKALQYEVVEVVEKDIPKFGGREVIPNYVPIQGEASKNQIEMIYSKFGKQYQLFDVATLVALASLVHPSKSAGDIPLAFDWRPPALPGITKVWADHKKLKDTVICQSTCRPYYNVGSKTWREIAEVVYGDSYAQFSCTRMFSEFVVKYGEFPTKQEFLVFLYNRYVVHGNYDCLPGFTMMAIDCQFKYFRKIMDAVSPNEFRERYLASAVIEKRILLEK